MIGDCDRCGHSVAYHVPFVGCMKCSCDEYAIRERIIDTAIVLALFVVGFVALLVEGRPQ